MKKILVLLVLVNILLYSCTLKKVELSTPTNLKVADNVLIWDSVTNAKIYKVLINEQIYEVKNNQFDLTQLDKNKFYEIKVKTIYNNVESSFSEIINYQNFIELEDSFEETFNLNNSNDFIFDFSEYEFKIEMIFYNEDKLDEDVFSIIGEQLSIINSYLKSLNYGKNELLLYTNKGKVKLNIDIYDERKPYLISNSNIKYEGKDLEFIFELYDGQILSITGNDINQSNYLIEGNKVIIYSSYIEGKFAENNERTKLILGYNLMNNSNVTIGYIFINK